MNEYIGYKRLIELKVRDGRTLLVSPSKVTIWKQDEDGYYLESPLDPTAEDNYGIYSVSSPTNPQLSVYAGRVYALSLYGNVVVGENGFRSSGARVLDPLMDIGKEVKIVRNVPKPQVKPIEVPDWPKPKPQPQESPIAVPDWPVRQPVEVPTTIAH